MPLLCLICSHLLTDPQLPDEETTREFSITLPFGTKSPESFAEAESYFVASTAEKPLMNASTTCSQGLFNDSSWTCTPFKQSHIVCGHYGVFKFAYPNYEVLESANYIRMYVQRSGGGYGDVTINYYIKHYTTNDSDVVATAPYTTVQQLRFDAGTVEKSFLITILDDNLVEDNEVFQVVLETPEGGGAVGAQFRTNVTIIDDDLLLTTPKLTRSLTNATTARAGAAFGMTVQARQPNGKAQVVGGDRFVALLENDQSAWSSGTKRQTLRLQCLITDLGNGMYTVSAPNGVNQQGTYQLRTWHAFPRAIQGEYFYDAFFNNMAVRRLDHAVNFTWGTGRLIPRGSDYISIRWSGAIRADHTGNYHFAMVADDYARLWVDGVMLLDHFHERQVFQDPPRAIILQAGHLYEFVLEYMELSGDAYASLQWSFNGAPLSVVPQDNYFSLFEIDRSPVEVTILSSFTSAATTECTGDGLYAAEALVPATFAIWPRDVYGNLRDDDNEFYLSSEHFVATMELVDDGGHLGLGVDVVTPVLTYDHSAHCFQGHYIPQKSGIYHLNITFATDPDSSPRHVMGSPFIVSVAPTKASGPFSQVVGLPYPLYAEAGYCYDFTVIARDGSNNLLLHGGDSIMVYMFRVDYYNETNGIEPIAPAGSPSARPTTAPTMTPTMMPTTFATGLQSAYPPRESDTGLDVVRYGLVTDLGNGNYSVRICPVIAGIHEVSILLNGKGVSNQPVRVMDRMYSTSLTSGRGSYRGQYIADSPYEMIVKHTKASVITSTVKGDGLLYATTAVSSFILLTVRDPYDNVLRTAYLQPNISIRLDRSPNATTSVWNYQNGSYLLEYIPQLSGLNYISVFVNGFQIRGSPFNVTVAAGQTKPSYSFAIGGGLHEGITGATSYFELFAYDGDGNRKPGYDDVFTFTVTGDGSGRRLSTNTATNIDGILSPCPEPRVIGHPACDPLDTAGGYFFGQFTPLVTGSITVRVFLNTSTGPEEISNSPFVAIVSPSPSKAESTDVSGTLYDNIAGVTAKVDLQLRDYFGNILQQGGTEIELALIGVAAEWGTVQPYGPNQGLPNAFNYKGFYAGYPTYYGSVADHLDGSYTLSYRAEQAGQYVMRLALAEAGLNATYFNDTHFGLLTDNSFASVEFVQSLQGRPVNYGSSWSWTGDLAGPLGIDGSRDGNSYYGKYTSVVADSPSVVLSTADPREYVTATGFHNFRQQYWSVRFTGMITPKVSEMHKFSVELDDDSDVKVWVGGVGAEVNMSSPGQLVLDVRRLQGLRTGLYNFTDLKHREIVVEFIHYTGDARLQISWEAISLPKQIIPGDVFTHWRNISHFNTTIHPAPLCSHCSTSFGDARYNAQVGHDHSFLVYARDTFGNLRQTGGDKPTMLAVGNDGVAFRGKITDYGNSTYLIRYYPTTSGTFRMFVSMGCCAPPTAVGYPSELQDIAPLLIQGAPFVLTVRPDALSSDRSVAVGKGLFGGMAGMNLSFTVMHRDRYNNPTTVDPNALMVLVDISNAVNGDMMIPAVLEVNKSAGNTSVTFQLTRAGTYSLSIKLNGRAVLASPFAITISPAPADALMAVCRGLGVRQASTNRSAAFEIALHDRFQNALVVGGGKFFIRLQGDADFISSSLAVTPACVDNLDGTTSCSYLPVYPGPHHLMVKLLRQPVDHPGGAGLLGSYYDSADGARSGQSARIIRIDPMVSFAWNDTLLPSAQPQTGQSVRWEGYLVPPRTARYTLTVAAQGVQAMIFIDSQLVFDSLSKISRTVDMLASAAYAIKMIVTSAAGSAGMKTAELRWSSPSIRQTSVSQFFLYDGAQEVAHSPFPVVVSSA